MPTVRIPCAPRHLFLYIVGVPFDEDKVFVKSRRPASPPPSRFNSTRADQNLKIGPEFSSILHVYLERLFFVFKKRSLGENYTTGVVLKLSNFNVLKKYF